jgi:integrase
VHTGLRPGTEMDNLKWRDLEMKDAHVVITVRKGKTTLHTGTRYVVGHRTVLDMILDMSARFDEVKDDDLVFRLSDGSTTNQLGRNFVALLKHLGLEKSASGTRTLYSLRHTYITQLMLAGLPPSVIAKQCGTSTAMIEQHYSHITPLMFAKELAGGEGAELTKLINKYADLA